LQITIILIENLHNMQKYYSDFIFIEIIFGILQISKTDCK